MINRVLEQWDPLTHYFLVCEFDEENDDLGKDISRGMNNNTKAYLFFISYVLKLTNTMNLEFQAEKPRVHSLSFVFEEHIEELCEAQHHQTRAR